LSCPRRGQFEVSSVDTVAPQPDLRKGDEMREMWELPKQGLFQRLRPVLAAAAVLWACAAIPLTIWLSLRTPPQPPPPPQREMTSVEAAAVSHATQSLRSEPVTLTSTTVVPMAQLEITETVDPNRRTGHGTVRSGRESAELLVVGDRVLLRGGAPFWATLGIPTAEPGWVDVGDRLGADLRFPLTDAAVALTAGPAEMVNTSDAPAGATVRAGEVTVVFDASGIASVTTGDRTATISRPAGDVLSRLAATPPPGWDAPVAVLNAQGGSLTVAPVPPPAPAPAPAPDAPPEPAPAP
jgi:hypothetical protein